MSTFQISIFVPFPNSNYVHNWNVSSIQIDLIWFSSFSTFGAFVRKPKPEKTLQRAATRYQRLISKLFLLIDLSLKIPENFSKIHAEIKKRYWGFKNAPRREKKRRMRIRTRQDLVASNEEVFVSFWCDQCKRWTNELKFRFRVWGNL